MPEEVRKPGKHYHTYKRVKHPTRRDIWMCADPNCDHRTNQIYLLGKNALCPYCDKLFKVTPRKLNKQSLLHCDACKRDPRGCCRKPVEPTVENIENMLKDYIA